MSLMFHLTSLPAEDLAALIQGSSSRKHVLQRIGFKSNDARALKYLTEFIATHQIDINHFTHSRRHTYDVAELRDAVAASHNMSQVLRTLGLSQEGNRQTIEKLVQRHRIDTSHFSREIIKARLTPTSILTSGSTASRSVVRRTVLQLQLLSYECATAGCKVVDMWNGTPLILELDHIDGDRTNNDLSNLRFLCPNCHSQTSTHRGKNRK